MPGPDHGPEASTWDVLVRPHPFGEGNGRQPEAVWDLSHLRATPSSVNTIPAPQTAIPAHAPSYEYVAMKMAAISAASRRISNIAGTRNSNPKMWSDSEPTTKYGPRP